MPKKRKKKRPQRSKSRSLRGPNGQKVILVEYSITFEPLKNKDLTALPKAVQQQIVDLFDLLAADPRAAIPIIQELLEQYPHIALLHNHLARAYSLLRDDENADRVTFETYKKFPDYLFGRINYAQVCLRNGEPERVPAIFNNTFDLKMLYPQRSEFHVSEVMNFCYIMAWYFSTIGKMDTANIYYDTMRRVDPDDPMVAQVERLLLPEYSLDRLKSAIQGEARKRGILK